MTKHILYALAALLLAREAPAQAKVVGAARIKQIIDSLKPAGSKSAQLGAGPNFTQALWHRDTSGGLERHERFTDIVIVQSGSATMLSGGVQEGATESSPGEWRGGTARGATRQVIRAGDVVTTLAGTPHQLILAPGERVAYVVIKVETKP